MLSDKRKEALYTTVSLLKGVIMQRALLLNPDEQDEFMREIDIASDAIVSDIYERIISKWESDARMCN